MRARLFPEITVANRHHITTDSPIDRMYICWKHSDDQDPAPGHYLRLAFFCFLAVVIASFSPASHAHSREKNTLKSKSKKKYISVKETICLNQVRRSASVMSSICILVVALCHQSATACTCSICACDANTASYSHLSALRMTGSKKLQVSHDCAIPISIPIAGRRLCMEVLARKQITKPRFLLFISCPWCRCGRLRKMGGWSVHVVVNGGCVEEGR